MSKAKNTFLPLSQETLASASESIKPQLLENNAEYLLLKKSLKNKKGIKGELSRNIGQAKKQQLPLDDLLLASTTITAEIKDIEKRISALLSHTIELLKQHSETSSQQIPALFSPFADTSTNSADLQQLHIQQVKSDEDIEAWQRYVRNNPRCSAYHDYSIRDCITRSMSHHSVYLLAIDNQNTVQGIFPSVQLRSKLFGNLMVSLPFFNYGGPVGNSDNTEQLLIKEMIKYASNLNAASLEMRDVKPREYFTCKSDKVAMILALPEQADKLWESIGSKVRAQIKKAQRYNLQTHFGKTELLDDFYQVFSRNMRDLGTPVYSKKFFRELLLAKNFSACLCVVYRANKPVSCAFLVSRDETMEIPWASTLKRANECNANMLLYWSVLEYAISKNARFFDFGRSTDQGSTYTFKKQWGAQAHPLYWHYWLAHGDTLPKINPDNPKYKLLITIWKKIPVWITRLIGPVIVKYIP